MTFKLVSIGGGTGQSTLLRGMRPYVRTSDPLENGLDPWIDELTAIVTVTDDGGSSGRLRRELDVPPPGDIRNCMVALADDEALMTKLFRHRFKGEGSLQGHSLGNLLLTALAQVSGDFADGVRLASQVLGIRGCVYPSTCADVRLVAELADGRHVVGETAIVAARSEIRRVWLDPPSVPALPQVVSAINGADIITLGPGSLYTSILPNLLVPEIAAALLATKAKKIFICNVMTQPGETDNYSVEDHVSAVMRCIPSLHLDIVLANATQCTRKTVPPSSTGQVVVNGSKNEFSAQLVSRAEPKTLFLSRDLADATNPFRHDAEKLAHALKAIANLSLTLPAAA